MVRPTRIYRPRELLSVESIVGDVSGTDVDWGTSPIGIPAASGRDQWKQPVRVASTASVTVSTALNNGDTIDGVTLATGDRVLLKDQSTGSQNGIYIVGATPIRAADMDDDDEVLGALVYVIAGTTNTATAWKVTNTAAVTVGSTSIVFAAFGTGGGSGVTVQDEGTPLATTGTTLNFVGSGVTATGAGATKTIAIPGGTALGWFNVEDYGAVHDGSTDDTVAIQAAITACMTAGGGTVYFPAGIYQISGALVSTGTFNSQLTIPNVTFGGEPKAIRFLGSGPNPTYGGSGTYGSVLRSDWNGSISGHPAIISAGLWHGTGANWSSVMVSFEDLVIIAHDDPKLTAIQMTCATDVRMTNVQIRTTTAAPASLPTHADAVGYEGPYGYLSQVPDEVHNVEVYGFYVGMRPAEQTTGGDLGFAFCTHGMEFVGDRSSGVYTFWPNYFSKVVITSCPRGLVFSGDLRWVNIGLFAVQHDPGTFATVYDIDDASNYWRGFISYNSVETTGTPSEDDILLNGATGGSLHWGHGQYWKLNSVVEIPTGTDPSTNPATGRKLYTASATGHLSVRTTAGAVVDLEALSGTAGGDLSGTYPNPSVVDDSHNHTAATLPASTSGAILIADTHSTPLVFADLLQTEAQDDLLYAD